MLFILINIQVSIPFRRATAALRVVFSYFRMVPALAGSLCEDVCVPLGFRGSRFHHLVLHTAARGFRNSYFRCLYNAAPSQRMMKQWGKSNLRIKKYKLIAMYYFTNSKDYEIKTD